jgi:hypothetical protein
LPDKAEEDVLINNSNPKTNLGGEISFWVDLFYFRAQDKTRQDKDKDKRSMNTIGRRNTKKESRWDKSDILVPGRSGLG